MKRFIQGEHRGQGTLLPESLDDYVSDTNPVRVVDVFVDELNLVNLGFEGAIPADAGRPAYHPAILLKIYIYGYLNRIQSSRRLEREAQRNVELMWLTGRLMPDFKTIANFQKDNSKSIRGVCRQFVMLCQQLGLFVEHLVAIDGSKFKAVNNRDRNFTRAKLKRRMEEIDRVSTVTWWRSMMPIGKNPQLPSPVPAPAVAARKKNPSTAFTPRVRVTLQVSNVFEGATQAYVHEADTISMLLAEQEAVKVARKKYRYVEVESVKPIG